MNKRLLATLAPGVIAAFLAATLACSDDGASKLAQEKTDEQTPMANGGSNQDLTPVEQISLFVVGFHPMKEDPSHQMTAYHYCTQLNEDMAQCILFNDNTADARMNGIEYIISEKLFESLPEEERQYWHPHNYEILSGQLVAPGMGDDQEKEVMREKMNSYGKTIHLWMDGDELPMGEPKLAWSLNHDGEAQAGLVEARDEKLDVDTQAKREARSDLVEIAKPQVGVNALMNFFGEMETIPGVEEKDADSSTTGTTGTMSAAPTGQEPQGDESKAVKGDDSTQGDDSHAVSKADEEPKAKADEPSAEEPTEEPKDTQPVKAAKEQPAAKATKDQPAAKAATQGGEHPVAATKNAKSPQGQGSMGFGQQNMAPTEK